MTDHQRIVITGLGVVAPNGVGIHDFRQSLMQGRTGIRFDAELESLGFGCQVSGRPPLQEIQVQEMLSALEQKQIQSSGLIYALIAAHEAWKNAGLPLQPHDDLDTEMGCIIGAGISGVEKFRTSIYAIDRKEVRKLGSTSVPQTMNSSGMAYISGKYGLGNWCTANSSACATGTEALWMAYQHLKLGNSKRMIIGTYSDVGPYIWGGFDAMRVCVSKYNETPESASRPLSQSAAGFAPSGGAGMLILETLDAAKKRGANILAEVVGGSVNCGGQRQGGSMTAPNPKAVRSCIETAVRNAQIATSEIDVIQGHLTATTKDADEIFAWDDVLGVEKHKIKIQAPKSHFGHALAAAGSIELVTSVLQLQHQEVYKNLNADDIHPNISERVGAEYLSFDYQKAHIRHLIKASFGFGDVNACVVLKKYPNE